MSNSHERMSYDEAVELINNGIQILPNIANRSIMERLLKYITQQHENADTLTLHKRALQLACEDVNEYSHSCEGDNSYHPDYYLTLAREEKGGGE